MKVIYATPELEHAALRDAAAAEWALTHRAEYDAMLLEAFPANYPRIPGEWSRRMDVVIGTAARLAGFPEPQKEAA